MKKRNISKLLPVALIASVLLFGTLLIVKVIAITSAETISLNEVVTAIALLSYLGITILTLLKNQIVKTLLIYTPLLSFILCTSAGGVFASSLLWMIMSSIALIALYQIKKQDVPYWNIIMGEPNSTKTLKDNISEYFSKSSVNTMDEEAEKTLKIGKIIVSVCIAVMLGVLIYAWGSVDFNIQWNMFESWLMPILYIVGLCITIFDPIPKYTSWLVYKDRDGKEVGREKNNDIMEVLFNAIVLPFLIRFIVYPMVGAAIIYYPLMVIIVLVEAVIPIVFLLIIAAMIPMYIILSKSILSFKNRAIHLKLVPIFTIVLVATITLIWLQNTDNKFSAYFYNTESTINSEIEEVKDMSIGESEITPIDSLNRP